LSRRFRMPCAMSLYQGNGRPVKPAWMHNKEHATRNQKRSHEYWTMIYERTPPWADQALVKQLQEIYLSCPDGWEVDHIIPLRGYIVSGLHIPANLQHLPLKENQHKSNNYWPDCPFEQGELF